MTREQIKQEFNRWINEDRPAVWYKLGMGDGSWNLSDIAPLWNYHTHYIVDDKYAELRKLQIDEPDTEFEGRRLGGSTWVDFGVKPKWISDFEYRVKHKEWYEDPDMIGKPVWVRDDKNSDWEIAIFKGYSNENLCNFNTIDYISWKYAKPVTWRDLYQGDSDDITK